LTLCLCVNLDSLYLKIIRYVPLINPLFLYHNVFMIKLSKHIFMPKSSIWEIIFNLVWKKWWKSYSWLEDKFLISKLKEHNIRCENTLKRSLLMVKYFNYYSSYIKKIHKCTHISLSYSWSYVFALIICIYIFFTWSGMLPPRAQLA
jgi:hypothetical protein